MLQVLILRAQSGEQLRRLGELLRINLVASDQIPQLTPADTKACICGKMIGTSQQLPVLLIVVGKLTKERSIEVGAGEKLYNPFSEMHGLNTSILVVLFLLLDGIRG